MSDPETKTPKMESPAEFLDGWGGDELPPSFHAYALRLYAALAASEERVAQLTKERDALREDAERWKSSAGTAAAVVDAISTPLGKLLPIIKQLKAMAWHATSEPWKPCERGADDVYLYNDEGQALACWFWKQHENSVTATANAEREAYASLEFIAEFRNRWREIWTWVEAIDAARRLKNG